MPSAIWETPPEVTPPTGRRKTLARVALPPRGAGFMPVPFFVDRGRTQATPRNGASGSLLLLFLLLQFGPLVPQRDRAIENQCLRVTVLVDTKVTQPLELVTLPISRFAK